MLFLIIRFAFFSVIFIISLLFIRKATTVYKRRWSIIAGVTAVLLIICAGSGFKGGRGLLSAKGSLPSAINTFDTIVSREIRRTNAKYSLKVIASAMADYNQAWMDNLISSGVRFIGGTAFVHIFGD